MDKKLTHKEEEIMHILWDLQKAFVNDILERMEEPKPPYNTVSSTVRKLVTDGVIGFEAFGKTHRYFPLLKKEDYRKTTMDDVVEKFFAGSPEQLLSYFIKEEKVDMSELNELLSKIKK